MWSPDGRYFAYRSAWGDACRGTVYITDAGGHAVASFPGSGWLVSWSPDSTRVATWVELWQTIGIYGLDGIRQALIPLPSQCASSGDWDPVWSPDSSSSVMASACEVPIDGGAPRRVPADNPRRFTRYPAYTPDGSRVAFTLGFGNSLVIAEADGTELRVLVGAESTPTDAHHYFNPIWSPAGDRVAYVWASGPIYDEAGNPVPNTFELRTVDVASGTVTSLTSAQGWFPISPIRFSPSGDRILFARRDENGVGTGLWSINADGADGSDPRLLVSGTGWGDWQPLPGRR
jgi:Tol biopolymer transport system component